jgi:hypothetical protein
MCPYLPILLARNATNLMVGDADRVTVTADEALAAASGETDGGALAEAKDVLRDLLVGGPLPAKDVQRQAKEVGISEATLRRAKDALGARAVRSGGLASGGKWVWELPDPRRCSRSPKVLNHSGMSILGEDEHLSAGYGYIDL